MNPTTPAADNTVPEPSAIEEPLDPRGAAALLAETSRNARRDLNPRPPLISAVQALVVLVTYGVLWLSVRGQTPYRGPSIGAVGAVYLFVAIGALVGVSVYYRAVHGVTGPSRRREWVEAIPIVVSLVGFYTFLGALQHDGFNHAVVYGVVDAAGPWLIVGAWLGAMGAAREDWWRLAAGIALVACGTAAAFAGPEGVWGVLALAGFALLLAQAVLRQVSASRA